MRTQTESEQKRQPAASRLLSSLKQSLPVRQSKSDNASPDDIDNEQERRRLQNGRSRKAASFRGRGLSVTWSKGGDETESKNDGFVAEKLIEQFAEDETGENVNIASDFFNENEGNRGSTTGGRIKDKYVFIMEVLNDRHFRLAMAAIYLAFTAYITVEFVYERRAHESEKPIAMRPENATSDEFMCYPLPNGTCASDQRMSVGQASLLANTVIISGGINVTDWAGNGVKPGSPPYSVFSESGVFVEAPSVLDPSANMNLQPFGDDIAAVLWFGFDDIDRSNPFQSFSLTFKVKKLDGNWPEDAAKNQFLVHSDSFSCVKGGKAFCNDIGNWRVQDRYENKEMTSIDKKGDTLSFFLGFNVITGIEFLEQFATRIVLSANNEASIGISDCLSQNNCIISAMLSGSKISKRTITWVLFWYFIIYMAFFIWWLISLHRRRGRAKMWPSENRWLVVSGIGLLLRINIYKRCLDLLMIYDSQFSFAQTMYFSAEILYKLGNLMMLFSLACFIDAPRKYVATNICFYGYKLVFFLIIFICDLLVIVYRYPQIAGNDEPGTESEIGGIGFGTSVTLWNDHDRNLQIWAVSLWMGFITFGIAYFLWKSFIGYRLLDSLPYGMTRHTQLSFRFFCYASTTWIFLEYIIVIVNFIRSFSHETNSGDTIVWSLSVTYYLTRTDQISSTTFFIIFHVVLQIFFLPLYPDNSFEKNKTHYLYEDDIEHCPASERPKTKYPMILEKAKLLCICSQEVYLPFDNDELMELTQQKQELKSEMPTDDDTKQSLLQPLLAMEETSLNEMNPRKHSLHEISDSNIHNTSTDGYVFEANTPINPGSSSPMKVSGLRLAGEAVHGERISGALVPDSTWCAGCRLVARIREPSDLNLHDIRVIMLRHIISGDLIVAFCGTKTTKHVKTDLMWSKVGVSLDTFLTAPSWTETIKKKITRTTTLLAHIIEGRLTAGEIDTVRVLDLLPKNNDELPPYLKDAYKNPQRIAGRGYIHFGFWSSYNRIRRELHEKIREELLARPGRVLITGHSLGGAQATICAYDMCRWVLPTVKHQLLRQTNEGIEDAERVHISCYTFGSPKVGNRRFVEAYNKVVPDTQRIVCDGDMITSGPPSIGYRHVKRENIFDFTGTVRAEPGLMEKMFSLKTRNRPNSHRMINYLKVIKKAFDPKISEEELLDIMRKAYRLKK